MNLFKYGQWYNCFAQKDGYVIQRKSWWGWTIVKQYETEEVMMQDVEILRNDPNMKVI